MASGDPTALNSRRGGLESHGSPTPILCVTIPSPSASHNLGYQAPGGVFICKSCFNALCLKKWTGCHFIVCPHLFIYSINTLPGGIRSVSDPERSSSRATQSTAGGQHCLDRPSTWWGKQGP